MEHSTTTSNYSISQYITVYYSISQYITVYYSILQYITVYHSISQYITVYYCKFIPMVPFFTVTPFLVVTHCCTILFLGASSVNSGGCGGGCGPGRLHPSHQQTSSPLQYQAVSQETGCRPQRRVYEGRHDGR